MPHFAFDCKMQSNLWEDRVEALANLRFEDRYMGKDESVGITTVCHLCGSKITGEALSWDGIQVVGAIAVHLA